MEPVTEIGERAGDGIALPGSEGLGFAGESVGFARATGHGQGPDHQELLRGNPIEELFDGDPR